MTAKRVFREMIVRAVLGKSPAILSPVADTEALDAMCQRLSDCEQALEIFRAKGYGKPEQSLVEVARMLPEMLVNRFSRREVAGGELQG